MRHIFIINPAAGLQNSTEKLRQEIVDSVGSLCEICVTEYAGHAAMLVRTKAAQYAPEVCRFYACGGDGTLSEAAAGAVGTENAQIACVPCGTGNDFIKIFDGREAFRDVRAQMEGETMPLDVLAVNDRYALNICNAGLDARICRWVVDNKRRCVFSGGFPYKLSLLIHFFRRINCRYRLEIDGKAVDEELAIAVAANARYYGGGFYACPEAEPDDGFFDFVAIRRITRAQLLRCLGDYAAGRHDRLGDLQLYTRARQMTLVSEKPEPLCLDGEILITDRAEIRVVPHAISFVVPKGAALIRDARKRIPNK